MSRTLMIAALTALLATSPAASADRQSPPAKGDRVATDKGKQTKYCIAYEKTTGSRIERTECRTKAEWAAEGIDVDNLDS